MNAESKYQLDDDARFDRLVDGALTPDEYKALLAGLDDEPGGWRRCSLAFLEAQAWGVECRAIRRMEPASKTGTPPVTKASPQPVRIPWAFSMICAAASFLLAFALGLAAHSTFFPDRSETHLVGSPSPGTNDQVPESPGFPAITDGLKSGELRLVVDRGDDLPPEEIVVPVRESTDPASETLVETDPAIPDSVLRALELRGHKVTREQEFIPVHLDDGRQVIFPVEQYRITPVNRKSY